MFTLISLAACLSVFTGSGSCCREKEYPTGDGLCCPMCHRGTVVRQDCTTELGTRCSPCRSGTFMNNPNGLKACFPCTPCDTVHGLFALQNCTSTADTVCDVLSGYFCKSLADDKGCMMADEHSQCAPGQGIKEPGTSRTDTVCEDCQSGYFSQDGVACKPWTRCSGTQVKVKEGGLSTDVICSGASRNHSLVLILLSCFYLLSWTCHLNLVLSLHP